MVLCRILILLVHREENIRVFTSFLSFGVSHVTDCMLIHKDFTWEHRS